MILKMSFSGFLGGGGIRVNVSMEIWEKDFFQLVNRWKKDTKMVILYVDISNLLIYFYRSWWVNILCHQMVIKWLPINARNSKIKKKRIKN